MKRILLNAGIVLLGLCFASLWFVRSAYWGPEGPVGGLLLLFPYLLLAGLVTGVLLALGAFSWMPGGKLTGFALWIGLLVTFSVSGYYAMSYETKFEQLAALFGWVLLAGCLVAANATPSKRTRTVMAVTLVLGGLAGWLQVVVWLGESSAENARNAESKIAHEQESQKERETAFKALGKEAPFWNYFGYMYISNEELRKECHDIMANRADRDASLVKYLGDEVLASDATRYIGEFHPAPGSILAPAFARYSDLVLSRIPQVNADTDQLSERSFSDIQDIIRAATRIHKGGGDLTPQLEGWRSYLKGFKNTSELLAEIDRTLPQSKAH